MTSVLAHHQLSSKVNLQSASPVWKQIPSPSFP